MTDDNAKSAHVPALDAAGHDVRRVVDVLETGAADGEILEAAQDSDRVVLTDDRKGFGDASAHAGALIADETMLPGELRRTVERIERVYPTLDDVVEFLSNWT